MDEITPQKRPEDAGPEARQRAHIAAEQAAFARDLAVVRARLDPLISLAAHARLLAAERR
jgi:hypothetical protein